MATLIRNPTDDDNINGNGLNRLNGGMTMVNDDGLLCGGCLPGVMKESKKLLGFLVIRK